MKKEELIGTNKGEAGADAGATLDNYLPLVPFLTKTYNSNQEQARDLLLGDNAGVFDI